jgi:3-oxoacyl-[acyl-carrier-protein] synthase-3
MIKRSRIVGCGSFLPEKVIPNSALSSLMDTTHEWIVTRTGIHQRHVAADNEKTSDLAFEACKRALKSAGKSPNDLDFILCATTTPDQIFPSTSTRLQGMLGMTQGFAMDLQAVCSGFIYALAVADNFITSGQARCGLVVGAETMSKLLDWTDRSTAILFGDGAGAVVLEAQEGTGSLSDFGVLRTFLHSDGRFNDILQMTGGPGSTKCLGSMVMQGQDVFRHAVEKLGGAIEEMLSHFNLKTQDIDWFVPHQANERIIDALVKRFDFPSDRVVKTVALHANTSAASIPLALDAAVSDGRIKKGDLVLLDALGGGLTWGSALIRW